MRLFSILCLSDLHVDITKDDGNTDNFKQSSIIRKYRLLSNFLESEKVNSSVYFPDFIAVCGDIFDKGKLNDNNVTFVKEKIFNVLKENLVYKKTQNIIIVPGNHDSCFEKGMEAELNDFSSKCIEQTGEKTRHFKKFINFCRDFRGDANDFPDGLKVFEEERICFWTINSEWLTYSLPSNRERLNKQFGIDIYKCDINDKESEFAVLPKNTQRNLEIIKTKYPDYFIITLIHRPIYSLCWSQKQESLYEAICQESDLILSGHFHPIFNQRPSMFLNLTQQFELGSASSDDVHEHNTADLLMINPLYGDDSIIHYPLKYDKDKGWACEKKSINTYPLIDKMRKYKTFMQDYSDEMCIYSKGFGKEDIKHTVYNHLSLREQDGEIFDGTGRHCDIVDIKELHSYNLSLKEDKTFRLIVYDVSELKDTRELDDAQKQYREFREKHMKEIINVKLILEKIVIVKVCK